MRKSTKVVIGFAVAGFVLPIPLLAFKSNAMLLFYLCPPSIVAWAFAIDGPRWLPDSGVLWLIMCATNAILYATLASAIALIYRLIRPDTRSGSLRLR
jgi:hypothetical protein